MYLPRPRRKKSCDGLFLRDGAWAYRRVGVSKVRKAYAISWQMSLRAVSPFRPLALPPWTIHVTQATLPEARERFTLPRSGQCRSKAAIF
jgi:hypothetical protein